MDYELLTAFIVKERREAARRPGAGLLLQRDESGRRLLESLRARADAAAST